MERLKKHLVRALQCAKGQDPAEESLRDFEGFDNQYLEKLEATKTGPPAKPDGGYGWVIVFASFLAHVTIYGVCWSVGMFTIMFLETFQQSKSATALVGSLLNALLFASGLVSSVLVARFGCRAVLIAGGLTAAAGIALSALADRLFVVYVTFSGLGGVGLGVAYIPAIVCVTQYFDRRRTIALGLAVSGVGFGGFVFPPIIRALLELFDWREVLLIIAGIVLVALTLSGALLTPPLQPGDTCPQDGIDSEFKSHVEVMKSFPMVILGVNNFFYCFGQVIVYVHLGAFAVSAGIYSKSGTAVIFSIIGISNLLGRVVHGAVCHFPRMATALVYIVSTTVCGVATLLITTCNGVTSLAVCASVFGFSSSCMGVLLPDIIICLVGERRLAVTYGFLMVFEGAGFMAGGPIAGLLYDYTLLYDWSFCLAGVLLLAAALVMVVPWRYGRTCRQPAHDPEVTAGEAEPATPVKVPADPRDFLCPPDHCSHAEDGGHQPAPRTDHGPLPKTDHHANDGDPAFSGDQSALDPEQGRLLVAHRRTTDAETLFGGGQSAVDPEQGRLLETNHRTADGDMLFGGDRLALDPKQGRLPGTNHHILEGHQRFYEDQPVLDPEQGSLLEANDCTLNGDPPFCEDHSAMDPELSSSVFLCEEERLRA